MYFAGLKSTRTERRSESRIRRSVSQVTSVPLAGANARVRRRYDPLEKQFLAEKRAIIGEDGLVDKQKQFRKKKYRQIFIFISHNFIKNIRKQPKLKKPNYRQKHKTELNDNRKKPMHDLKNGT